MLSPHTNGFILPVVLFLVCCWVNPNNAIPNRTLIQVREKADHRAGVGSKMTEMDSEMEKKATSFGGGKKWTKSRHPRNIQNSNENANVNANSFGPAGIPRLPSRSLTSSGKEMSTNGATVTSTPRPTELNLDSLKTHEINCSKSDKPNDRYSSSFLANSTLGDDNNVADDEFRAAIESGTKKTTSVHVGEDVTLCWIETTTIKEDRSCAPAKRLVIREYTISFENSATIPGKYIECVQFEGEVDPSVPKSALFEVIDENTHRSRVVNFTTVSHSDYLTVWVHKRVRCGMGPVVRKDIIAWSNQSSGKPKTRVEIKVSPQTHNLTANMAVPDPCTTDIDDLRPRPTAPKSDTTSSPTIETGNHEIDSTTERSPESGERTPASGEETEVTTETVEEIEETTVEVTTIGVSDDEATATSTVSDVELTTESVNVEMTTSSNTQGEEIIETTTERIDSSITQPVTQEVTGTVFTPTVADVDVPNGTESTTEFVISSTTGIEITQTPVTSIPPKNETDTTDGSSSSCDSSADECDTSETTESESSSDISDSSCDEEEAECSESSETSCDEESGDCSADSSSASLVSCDEESEDCDVDSLSQISCDEDSDSCSDSSDDTSLAPPTEGSKICEDGSTENCTTVTTQAWNTSDLPTTTLTTVESGKSTTLKTTTVGGPQPHHKLALKIVLLLEHIDDNDNREKLIEVERHLLFEEKPDQRVDRSLIDQIESLNNSINMNTVRALFNCSKIEGLAGNVGVFAANYPDENNFVKNISESDETRVRKTRDLSDLKDRELNFNIGMFLPGIHTDIHSGFDNVLIGMGDTGNRINRRSAEKRIPHSRILKLVADPQDTRFHERSKRRTIEELTIDEKDMPEDVEEVGHWSNERVKRTSNGGRVRSLTEFTIYKDP